MAKLTPKQAVFIAEYLADGNGTRAAMAAGVGEKSASTMASRWLRNPKVAAAIVERQARRAQKLEITAERVLQEIAKLAFYDPGRIFDEGGNLVPMHLLDETTRAAIAGIETETRNGKDSLVTVVKKFRLADKGQNLERLGKHLKLFGDSSFGATVELPGGLSDDSTIKIVLVRPE